MTESLEQAAREFLKREDVTAFADNTVSSGGYEPQYDDLIELLMKFAAERERQVWAEAAKVTRAVATYTQSDAVLGLATAFEASARGEQVK